MHAVHVPTDTTVIFLYLYTNASTTRRSGGRVKFTCSTKDIASAVGAASKIVNAHTTVPILSNVLLTADDDGHQGSRHRSRADARTIVPGRDRRARRGDRSGQAVLRLSRQLAGRVARTQRLADPGLDQGRTLELRFSGPPAGRVSAAARPRKRAPRSRSRPRSFATASTRRSSPPRAKRRAAPC